MQTITKCMDAVLAPLRLQGGRVLNYLDDWLVLVQPQTQARSLSRLGLHKNTKNSVLIPCQRITFFGDISGFSRDEGTIVSPRVQSYKAGLTVTVSLYLRLLGLMAEVSPGIRLGLLSTCTHFNSH